MTRQFLIPVALNRTCDEFIPAADQTLRDLVLDSETGLPVVKTLKGYGRELARSGRGEAKRAAAIVVDYAAMASALAFHQQMITRHSSATLQEALADLERKQRSPSD